MKTRADSTIKFAQRPCPITSDREVMILHHQRFLLADGNPLPSEYDVVWSRRAGFAYADTPLGQSDYDRYYTEFSKYEDSSVSTGGGETPSDAERLAHTADDIARVVGDRNASVLDIGCANGGLLVALRKLGFSSVAGIDPSPACVRTVRTRHGIPAEAGGLFELPARVKKPDVVVLSHVLEHVYDLPRAIQVLHGLLSEKGMAYIEVPDAARYRDYIFAPFQDFNTEHINHFSTISLTNLMRSQGFELVSCGTKIIQSSPQCPYPALFGFFRKRDGAIPAEDFQRDDELLASLQEYIARSAAKLAQIESVIRPLVQAQTPLFVWGTGQLTMKLLAETALAKANLVAFVDSNPINQGKTLSGRAIRAPEQIPALGPGASILIATLLHQQAITHRIRNKLGLTNPIIVLN
jgi:SAM-dependent methyltransferase